MKTTGSRSLRASALAALISAGALWFGWEVPASAAAESLEPTSDWRVERRADRCRLSRNFGEGKDLTSLWVDKGGNGPTFNLTISGRAVRNPRGSLVSLRFGPDEAAVGRNYISAKSNGGRPVMVMYGAGFALPVKKRDGTYVVDDLDQERIDAIRFLQVERAGLKPFRLELGEIGDAVTRLRLCAFELAVDLWAARDGKASEAIPLNPGDWVRSSDYPPLMLKHEQEARIRFRLTVGKDGQASFCHVESSSMPNMFDDYMCLALLKRARFTPARDLEGNPIASYYDGAVRFMIAS